MYYLGHLKYLMMYQKLDFADCLLYGYSVAKDENVFTFDKKLYKKIKESKQ